MRQNLQTMASRLFMSLDHVPLPQPVQAVVEDAVRILKPPLTKSDVPPASVLLQAPVSGGKSLVCVRIQAALQSDPSINPQIVHLRGLLHSTPQRAWREVATCLVSTVNSTNKEDLSNQQSNITNFSDGPFAKATIDQCLGAIRTALNTQRDDQTSKPILFILDDFERFASSPDGPSQNVLYSLLNFLQDRSTKAACLAMTTHLDVIDNLEKRVKSRFACREIVIPQPIDTDEVIKYIHALLTTKNPNTSTRVTEKQPKKRVKRADNTALDKATRTYKSFVEKFISDPRLGTYLAKRFARTRVLGPVLESIEAAVVAGGFGETTVETMSMKNRITAAYQTLETSLVMIDPYEIALKGLSALEMALLISLRKVEQHLSRMGDKCSIVFDDVFRQYESVSKGEEGLLSCKEGERTAAKDVAEKSWERLIECGLVVRQGQGTRDVGHLYLAVDGFDVDHALKVHPLATTTLQRWGRV